MKVYVLTEIQTNDNGNVCSMVRSVSSTRTKAVEHYRRVRDLFVKNGNDVQEIVTDGQFRACSEYSSVIVTNKIEEVPLDA